jgi:Ca2+-binding EF-hand superfamily protein
MANGIRGLAFPTFGGQKDFGGVTPIQIPQVRTAFPTARGPVRRPPEPTTKEKIAGILPLLVSGATNFFTDRRQPEMTVGDYIKSIGADPEDLSREEQAQVAAFAAYGPQQDVGGFKGEDLFNLVAASQMGRGAPAYVQSALSIRGAENERKRLLNQQRGQLIKEFLKEDTPTSSFINVLDVDAQRNAGVSIVKPAVVFNKTTSQYEGGRPYLFNDEGELELAGNNWIRYIDADSASAGSMNDPISKNFLQSFDEIKNKDIAAIQFLNVAVPQLNMLKTAIDDPTKSGITTVSDIANFANSMGANFRQIGAFFGTRYGTGADDMSAIFSKNDEGGTLKGSGQIAESTFNALETYLANPDDENAIAALNAQFDTLVATQPSFLGDFSNKLGQVSFNNVRTRANFLQMAYMLAAINGQTGRTLSDKDLAYHLNIVGFDATQDANVAYHNLLRVADQMVTGLDSTTQREIPTSIIRHMVRTNNDNNLNLITDFYKPSKLEGSDDYNFSDVEGYQFIGFFDRPYNKGNKIINQFRTFTTDPNFYTRSVTTSIGPREVLSDEALQNTIKNDIEGINNLYKK